MGVSLRSLVQVLRRMKKQCVSNGTGYRISEMKNIEGSWDDRKSLRSKMIFLSSVASEISLELRFQSNTSRLHSSMPIIENSTHLATEDKSFSPRSQPYLPFYFILFV